MARATTGSAKAPAKKATAKKAATPKAVTNTEATAKKAAVAKKEAPATKATAATKKAASVAPAKGAVAKKAAPAPAAAAKKAASATAATKKAAPVAPAKGAVAKKAAPAPAATKKAAPAPAATKKAAPAKKAAVPAAKVAVTSPYDTKFLDEMRAALISERAKYFHTAEVAKAEADELAQMREPGDVQFDDESGEGDTLAVERDFDLALSAQARLTVEEIDRAFDKIAGGTYGVCEVSGQAIPKERLRAIPWARERVEHKVGTFGNR